MGSTAGSGFKATAKIGNGGITAADFDHPQDAWIWLRGVRDEQDALAGLEYTPTARRLHEIVKTVQAFGELTGTGTVFGPLPGMASSDDPADLVHCTYTVEAL